MRESAALQDSQGRGGGFAGMCDGVDKNLRGIAGGGQQRIYDKHVLITTHTTVL